MTEAVNPKSAPATPYELLGGESRVRELVERFYDLMEIEPKYADLRATHHDSLALTREKLFLFLSGWLGGPQLYVEQYGHPRLRARHMPFKVGAIERDQWVACMAQAMREINVAEALFQKLINSFYNTAEWMRNQPDAVEGEPQMPMMGVKPPDLSAKFAQLSAQYGVAITPKAQS